MNELHKTLKDSSLVVLVIFLSVCLLKTTLVSAETQTKRTTVTTVTTTKTGMVADYNTEDDIDFKININEKFRSTDDIEGEIIVTNSSTVNLPAAFHVKLFHNDSLFRDMVVHMDGDKDKVVSPGKTSYTLKEFGIPDLNKNRNYSGKWVIMIYQNDPAQSKEASFEIEFKV